VIGTDSNSTLGIYQVVVYSKQVSTCDFTRVYISAFTSRVVTWMKPCAFKAMKRKKKISDHISLVVWFVSCGLSAVNKRVLHAVCCVLWSDLLQHVSDVIRRGRAQSTHSQCTSVRLCAFPAFRFSSFITLFYVTKLCVFLRFSLYYYVSVLV